MHSVQGFYVCAREILFIYYLAIIKLYFFIPMRRYNYAHYAHYEHQSYKSVIPMGTDVHSLNPNRAHLDVTMHTFLYWL